MKKLSPPSIGISLEKFRESFDAIPRETDIKGWYRENKTIGIVYTDMSTNGRDLVLKKVKDCLKNIFGNDIARNSYVNTYFYPEDLGKEVASPRLIVWTLCRTICPQCFP
jgi:hypothetical protein